MDCSKAAELFSGYIDGMLNDDDTAKLKEHMDTCAICRQEYETFKTMVDKCRELDEVDLPAGFDRNLHERMKMEKRGQKRGMAFLINRYRGIAAAFLIFTLSVSIATAMGLFGGSQKKSNSTAESLTANDVRSANQKITESESADKSAQTAEGPAPKEGVNGLADSTDSTSRNSDNDIVMFSVPAAPEASKGANALSDNSSYDLVNVNISKADYDKCSQNIISLIESMGGHSISIQPLQYSIPEGYTDEFINKMRDNLKIEDIVVSTVDISEKDDNLKLEKNVTESRQNALSNGEISGGQGSKTDLKKSMTVQEDDAANNTIIQININE